MRGGAGRGQRRGGRGHQAAAAIMPSLCRCEARGRTVSRRRRFRENSTYAWAITMIACPAKREAMAQVSVGSEDVGANAIVTSIHLSASGTDAFPSWQSTLTRLISSQPDFLSVEILPTHQGSAQWQIVQRFNQAGALERWLANPQRQALMAELMTLKAPDGAGLREEIAPDYHALGGVTEVITTVVEPGREDDFLVWTEAIQAAQSRFPGYMGSFVQAPVARALPHWATLRALRHPGSTRRLAGVERAARIARQGRPDDVPLVQPAAGGRLRELVRDRRDRRVAPGLEADRHRAARAVPGGHPRDALPQPPSRRPADDRSAPSSAMPSACAWCRGPWPASRGRPWRGG